MAKNSGCKQTTSLRAAITKAATPGDIIRRRELECLARPARMLAHGVFHAFLSSLGPLFVLWAVGLDNVGGGGAEIGTAMRLWRQMGDQQSRGILSIQRLSVQSAQNQSARSFCQVVASLAMSQGKAD